MTLFLPCVRLLARAHAPLVVDGSSKARRASGVSNPTVVPGPLVIERGGVTVQILGLALPLSSQQRRLR